MFAHISLFMFAHISLLMFAHLSLFMFAHISLFMFAHLSLFMFAHISLSMLLIHYYSCLLIYHYSCLLTHHDSCLLVTAETNNNQLMIFSIIPPLLTYWDLNQHCLLWQTIPSDAGPWNKVFAFWLHLCCNIFLGDQLTKCNTIPVH